MVLEGVICTNIPAAASTALAALSMPAPQVAVVQTHSAGVVGSVKLPFASAVESASWHWVLLVGEEVGNASALDSMRAMICAGVRPAFSDSIRAATPETIGAAKLVPTLAALLGIAAAIQITLRELRVGVEARRG